jgi:hypothetical protein
VKKICGKIYILFISRCVVLWRLSALTLGWECSSVVEYLPGLSQKKKSIFTSHCCATITTIPLQNFSSSRLKLYPLHFSSPLSSPTTNRQCAFCLCEFDYFKTTNISGGIYLSFCNWLVLLIIKSSGLFHTFSYFFFKL